MPSKIDSCDAQAGSRLIYSYAEPHLVGARAATREGKRAPLPGMFPLRRWRRDRSRPAPLTRGGGVQMQQQGGIGAVSDGPPKVFDRAVKRIQRDAAASRSRSAARPLPPSGNEACLKACSWHPKPARRAHARTVKYTLHSPVSQSVSFWHALPKVPTARAGGAIAASTSTVATSASPFRRMVGMRGVSGGSYRGSGQTILPLVCR